MATSTSARQATSRRRPSRRGSSGTCPRFAAGRSSTRTHGLGGAGTFIRDWVEAWDDWEVEVESLHDAGDKVVAILRQHGRSKATGLPVDMRFGQVWTIRDGKQLRMQMYASPEEALEATGLGA